MQLAVAFHVDLVEAVDHDFGDGGVVQEPLDGTVAQHVVDDLADQPLAFLAGERNLLLVDDGLEFVFDRLVEFSLAD